MKRLILAALMLGACNASTTTTRSMCNYDIINAGHICIEGPLAADIDTECTTAGASVKDGQCNRTGVVAGCKESSDATIWYYYGSTADIMAACSRKSAMYVTP
jgi:hypothetical protein